ncbi:MAG: sigma-70 family RNA polymerase sigma factor [Clostridia bacterium]|nr:sigma-70 family RNA polymerase sigma factor [Clostridia bacterium]
MVENEQLAIETKKGNQKAFEILVKRFQQPIYTLCYRFLGNRADAYDASQETFIRLYQKIHLFDTSQPFKPWLYRMAINICNDHYKKKKTWENLDTSLKSTWGNPQEDLEKTQLQKIIQEAVFRLPEKYRAAIILRHLRDLEYEEIAQVLDLPLNTVKTHIRRGRELLRKDLKEVLS